MKHAPLAAAVLLAIPALAQNGESEDLQAINVKSSGDDTRTEDTRSYTTAAMRTTTGLALAPQETPQSVSVVTKTQLDERGITTMHDALKTTTGINVIPDSGRWRYQSRGRHRQHRAGRGGQPLQRSAEHERSRHLRPH